MNVHGEQTIYQSDNLTITSSRLLYEQCKSGTKQDQEVISCIFRVWLWLSFASLALLVIDLYFLISKNDITLI